MGGLWQGKLKGDKSWNSLQKQMVGKKNPQKDVEMGLVRQVLIESKF